MSGFCDLKKETQINNFEIDSKINLTNNMKNVITKYFTMSTVKYIIKIGWGYVQNDQTHVNLLTL